MRDDRRRHERGTGLRVQQWVAPTSHRPYFSWGDPPLPGRRPQRTLVLYICIPAYNEAQTVGVLLWRIRKVFQEYSREYEILVYNDGSTDATDEALKPYGEVLPLTVLGGAEHLGYGRALDSLCRAVSARTRYPRRDALITLQADFTDQPEHLPELVKRFEGGADLVVGERTFSATTPTPVRRLRWISSWVARVGATIPGVTDPFGSMRLYRISLIRDAIKAADDGPLVQGDGWAANLDLLRRTVPHARRVETVALDPRYDVRARDTRIRPWSDGLALLRSGRAPRDPKPTA
jgi:glycosyltransferase involved in cell wall biosynthesis